MWHAPRHSYIWCRKNSLSCLGTAKYLQNHSFNASVRCLYRITSDKCVVWLPLTTRVRQMPLSLTPFSLHLSLLFHQLLCFYTCSARRDSTTLSSCSINYNFKFPQTCAHFRAYFLGQNTAPANHSRNQKHLTNSSLFSVNGKA